MPVTVRKRGDKYRIVEVSTGKVSVTRNGIPKDGGGHISKKKARRQARAINDGLKQENR